MAEKIKFRVGDAVVVKPGVMCPDKLTLSLAGWQGWVKELYPEEGTLEITWDSQTLRSIPEEYIRESEMEGLDWQAMGLGVDELASATPRDTPRQARSVAEEIMKHHAWDYLADENPGIAALLGPLGITDETACLHAWHDHLTKVLQFPFEARVREMLFDGPYRIGDRVQVEGLEDVVDDYGLFAHVRLGKRRFAAPLCDLQAGKHSSPNYQPLRDYVVWYANR